MPRRVYSRHGCLKCRARRKKCDEERPVCRSCRNNSFTCVWRGDDRTVVHVLPSTRILGAMYAFLRTQDETCNYILSEDRFYTQWCPRSSLSPGFTPIRDDLEHRLLGNLSGFLSMLVLNEAGRDHTHIFRVGLQSLWVRDSMLAFCAFLSSARMHSLRTAAYRYYNSSIAQVQEHVRSSDVVENKEDLLIATFFLGLMEVYNPENAIFPLLHFEAVGRLLDLVAQDSAAYTDLPTIRFRRIALESYLYHVAILSLFYPQTDRYSELSPQVDKQLSLNSPGLDENLIVSLDINIYRMLFSLVRLGRARPVGAEYESRLTTLQRALDLVFRRAQAPRSTHEWTEREAQFNRMTRLAVHALKILMFKVRNRQVLAGNDLIKIEVTAAIQELQLCIINRAWTGNFVWILTILLCAAYVTSDFEILFRKLEAIAGGMWGCDLARIQAVLRVVQDRRQNSCKIAADADGIVRQEDYDSLAMLLHPRGILGADQQPDSAILEDGRHVDCRAD